MKYSDIIEVNPIFQSSVNLQFDLNSEQKIKQYIPTPEACLILDLYIDAVLDERKREYRSTLLYGPYGKGKSFLILVLLYLFSGDRNSKTYQELLAKIKIVNHSLYEKLVEMSRKGIRLLPVIINSDYDDMDQAFLIGLSEALHRESLDELIPQSGFDVAIGIISEWKKDKAFMDSIGKVCIDRKGIKLTSLEKALKAKKAEGYTSFCEFYKCVSGGLPFNPMIKKNITSNLINTVSSCNSFSGVFIVFDEFGKFLDSRTVGISQQLKILQDIFELSVRSSESEQIHLCCVNHKKLASYAKNVNTEHAMAFRTIEGRVKEISFVRTMNENYHMIANALIKKPGFDDFWKVHEEHNLLTYQWYLNNGFVDASSADVLFRGCFPLNPLAAYCLICLSEAVAQNERTLFTFISDNNINSLNSFIHNNMDGEYGIDRLYDYFSQSFEKEEEEIQNIWTKTEAILSQTVESEERVVIKAIAVSLILNDSRMFPCTEEYLSAALSTDVSAVLSVLSEKQYISRDIITGQYYLSSYLNRDIQKALLSYQSKHSSINICTEIIPLTPVRYVSPRKYNTEMKMTRYYGTVYIEDSQFMNLVSLEEGMDVKCDGVIYQILNVTGVPSFEIMHHFQSIEIPDTVIVGLCEKKIDDKFYSMLRDYCAISDLILKTEYTNIIKSEMTLLRNRLQEEIGNELQLIFDSSTWLNDSNSSLSDIMYTQLKKKYPLSLVVNNELLNKHKISSTYRKARDRIVDRILAPQFDLSDLSQTSAEMTVYNSVFDEPDNNVHDAISELYNTIVRTSGKKNRFSSLYNLLVESPYGTREGVIPLLIAKAISRLSGSFILYFSDREIDLTSVNISKAVECPDEYWFLFESNSAMKTLYMNRIAERFNVNADYNFSRTLQSLVTSMQRYFAELPLIIKSGKADKLLAIDEKTRRLIRLFLKYDINRYELIFKSIPRIYSEDESSGLENVFLDLQCSLKHLDVCLDEAITDIACRICTVFGGNENESLKSAISGWKISLGDVNKTVGLFHGTERKIMELLVRNDLPYNDSEVVNSIARTIKGMIVADWQSDFSDEILNLLAKVVNQAKNAEILQKGQINHTNVQLSPLGKTLRSHLMGTIGEYGDSISEEEKLAILNNIIEELGL